LAENKICRWIISNLDVVFQRYSDAIGFWGQLKPTDYPEDWYEINDILNNDPQDFNVLFLPWHQYMDFKWIPNTQKRVANPASNFFDKPAIQGENTEISTSTPSPPTRRSAMSSPCLSRGTTSQTSASS